MKIIKNCFLFIIVFFTSLVHSAEKQTISTASEYFSVATQAFSENNWRALIYYANSLIRDFPNSQFAKDAYYYLGVAFYNLNDFEKSNSFFSKYLKGQFSPKHFEEAIHYKYAIAEKFSAGKKKRLLGLNRGPKILSAKEDAIEIYDEVISAFPNDELATFSLFSKGSILAEFEEYKESIDTFNLLIRRFPKHELAIESFIEIGKVYLKQTSPKEQNFNLLDLAKLNIDKFKQAFPSEERVSELEKNLVEMKEIYAKSLFEIAQFFEKTKKNNAAILYYSKIIASFPETKTAKEAKVQLQALKKKSNEK